VHISVLILLTFHGLSSMRWMQNVDPMGSFGKWPDGY